MKIRKLIATAAASGLLSLSASGLAMAQDVTIEETGPHSDNTVTYSQTNTFTQTNNNNVDVRNTNTQTATTGDASVSTNTNAGDAMTGDASNVNNTSTTVSINNESALCDCIGGNEGGGNQGGGNLGGGNQGGGGLALGGGSTSGVGGGSLGGVGGGSLGGVGGGELPETGPASPLDVSNLRNLGDKLPSQNGSGLSAILLSAAALLSLVGAAGSAFYANKKAVA